MSNDGKLVLAFNQPLLMTDELKNINGSLLSININGLPIINLISSDSKLNISETEIAIELNFPEPLEISSG